MDFNDNLTGTSIVLSELDRHFAKFVCRLSGSDEVLFSAAAFLSRSVGSGHICLDLSDVQSNEVGKPGFLAEWIAHLKEQSVVGAPGQRTPLILDGAGRLYLYRYWLYESELAKVLLEKSSHVGPLNEQELRVWLNRIFPLTATDTTDWQKVAAVAATRSRLCVISGGPGTGKTTTVVKIIALLLGLAGTAKLRIALAAPTGKAAARLKESICGAMNSLDVPDNIKAGIHDDVTTLHRLLGIATGTERFRYNADNPLPHDVVVVDEASMVALPHMAKLATALHRDALLILLGDRDQLASVEAGAVLGDICGAREYHGFSSEFKDMLRRLGVNLPISMDNALEECEKSDALGNVQLSLPLAASTESALIGKGSSKFADSVVVLEKNYRFGIQSGIGKLSRLVNLGHGKEAFELLKSDISGSLGWRDAPLAGNLEKALTPAVLHSFTAYLAASSPSEALKLFGEFRILCALRQGAYGVSEINSLVERILADHGLVPPLSRWYKGRPVMVTANDYSLKLFNGDIGIIFPDLDTGGALRAFFQSSDNSVRQFSPLRLPAHETAFAMTIHKSQGSEFNSILMVLPPADNEILTRELVYTGMTRARSKVEIWGDENVFVSSVTRTVKRNSGLRQALWGG